jgi:CRISPR/Cas system CSM-associated protein Csm3 (group 7 of RAMP superfamily)
MTCMVANFRVLSFWRVGTGRGELGTLDSHCARDDLGLPVIPGRSVRGLFREAVREAAALGLLGDNSAETKLFGTRLGGTLTLGDEPEAGTLRFEDARLPTETRTLLAMAPALASKLFTTKRSTAMDRFTGAAKPRSLRFDEVALPVDLVAPVDLLFGAPADAFNILETVAPLIRGVGSQRTRGLGRVIVTVKQGAAA